MKKLTSKQTRLFQAKMFARPLNFPQHIVDCGEVTSGPIRRVPPGAILSLLVVPNHTWKALACAIQWRVVPSTDWCLRKPSFSSACICAPRPVSTWVETAKIVLDILCAPATDDAYNHTFQPTQLASECYAVGYGPNKSTDRRKAVITNSPTKGRVEVVRFNCYCHRTKWKYPFLTGPERDS